MPASPLSGTVFRIEQIIDRAVHNKGSNIQNVHLLFLMAYEYLTARVTVQKIIKKNTVEINKLVF